jgi:hypothetical protein
LYWKNHSYQRLVLKLSLVLADAETTDLGLVDVVVRSLIWSTNNHDDVILAFVDTEIVDRWFQSMRIF